MRRARDPEEMKTRQFVPCTMVALLYMGGHARKEPVIKQVGEMLKDRLKPADWKLMYHGPSGQDYAPDGYVGKSWPVWEGKASLSHEYALRQGWLTASKGVQTLTSEGIKQAVMYEESLLRERP